MTIVHLVIDGDVAGGQLVARRFMHAARARGDRVVAVAPTRGAFVDMLERDGFPVQILDLSRTFRLDSAWSLRALLRRERATILHTHTQLAGNILGRVAARLAGTAVISHMHIENHFRPQRAAAAVHAFLDNATARLCARILVVSGATWTALEKQGYPTDRMEVVHNGVELPPRSAGGGFRVEVGIPLDAKLIGAVGRLCAVKGQRELIEAVARAPESVHLVLVGKDLEQNGAYEAGLRADAARLGVTERVVFAGYRPDVAALLAELDLFVLPSWAEGLPLVVLEAMAAGLPVVATRVGGTPELVVDGETGILVEPRDIDALARAITDLVDSPERRRKLGDAGRERVRTDFSAAAMSSRVLAVYEDVAGASRRPEGDS